MHSDEAVALIVGPTPMATDTTDFEPTFSNGKPTDRNLPATASYGSLPSRRRPVVESNVESALDRSSIQSTASVGRSGSCWPQASPVTTPRFAVGQRWWMRLLVAMQSMAAWRHGRRFKLRCSRQVPERNCFDRNLSCLPESARGSNNRFFVAIANLSQSRYYSVTVTVRKALLPMNTSFNTVVQAFYSEKS